MITMSKRDQNRTSDPATSVRDAALLALRSAGIGATEIRLLNASNIRMIGGAGRLYVERWAGNCQRMFRLSDAEGARLLEYIESERCWGEDVPLFRNDAGKRLSLGAVWKVLGKR